MEKYVGTANWISIFRAAHIELSKTLRPDKLIIQPLHGDPSPHNLFVNPQQEIIWADLEDSGVGPIEWDFACLFSFDELFERPSVDVNLLRGYGQEIADELFQVCLKARAMQIATWSQFMALFKPVEYTDKASIYTQKLLTELST